MTEHLSPESPDRVTSPSNRISFEGWAGPVPDPATMRGFEEAIPGSGDRLIAVLEMQVQGRIAGQQYERVTVRTGWYLVFMLSVLLIGSGLVAMFLGYGWALVPASVLALASLVSSITGLVLKRNEPTG